MNHLHKTLSYFVLLAGLAGPLTYILGRWHWIPDAFSNFCLQYHIVLAVCIVVLLMMKQWGKAALNGIFFIGFFSVMLLPYYIPQSDEVNSITNVQRKKLSVFYANVYTRNDQHEKLAELIRETNPDIAVFLEVGESWARYLEKLMSDYEYNESIVREDNFGLAVYSRIPMKIQEKWVGSAEVPSYRASIQWGEGESVLWVTHPLPPVGHSYWDMRNRQLFDISKIVSKENQDVIFVGDLNVSPWSYWFRKIISNTNLRDTALGKGIRFTWSSMSPLFLRTAIDHILISENLFVSRREVMRSFGSDHFPIYVELENQEWRK